MALTIVAAFLALAPSAFAVITNTPSTVYGSDVPGAHTDYTIIQNFEYGNGTEPKATTAPGQDMKKWIVDSPAGLVGNPNAIPQAQRCDPAAFDTTPTALAAYNPFFPGSCPASAKVGEATVYLVNDADAPTPACTDVPADPFDCFLGGTNISVMTGTIYLLKTDPEIPVTLGTIFTTNAYQSYDFTGIAGPTAPTCTVTIALPTVIPCVIHPKTKSILAPVTNQSAANNGDSDFRIRTVPAEYTNPPGALLPTTGGYSHLPFTPGNPSQTGTPTHIRRIDQKLLGKVDPNVTPGDTSDDVPFLTMPTRCDSWDSYVYGIAWNGGGGSLSMDPNHTGGVDSTYVKSAADSKTPNCSTLPPLKATASAVLSSGARDSNPGLSVTISDPTASGDDNPKKIVVTLPPAVAADVDALNNVCSVADRNADNCPAASKVGTATIATPLIQAGLTGTVYMTASPNKTLPYLSIFVNGAVKFRLDATTQFVGPAFNEIESTFDTLPQTPFTKFTVNIDGGKSNSLLYNRACPTDGTAPPSGSTTFGIFGYTGQVTNGSSPNTFAGCYGVAKPVSATHCKKQGKSYKWSPQGVIDRPGVKNIKFQTGTKTSSMHTRATDSKSPFAFKLTLKKENFKKNKKYYFRYRVEYKDGTIIKSKSATFKTCK